MNKIKELEKIRKILDKGYKKFSTSKPKITKSRIYFPKETKKQYYDKLENDFLVSMDMIQKIDEDCLKGYEKQLKG